MSLRNFSVCDCDCHNNPQYVHHVAPCCDGPCESCGKNIMHGFMAQHQQGCCPDIQEKKKPSFGFPVCTEVPVQ